MINKRTMEIINKLIDFVDAHGMTISLVAFLVGMTAIGYARYCSH